MSNKILWNEVKSKCVSIHGNRFNYDFNDYIDSSIPFTIKCNAEGHVFKQTTNRHYEALDCPICLGYNKTTEEFIKQSKKINGERYLYDLVKYEKCDIKVTLICRIHGPFQITPNAHLSQKGGCPVCGGTMKKTLEKFIEDAIKVHGDCYWYGFVDYVNKKTYINIYCYKHGFFPQMPDSHLRGRGCPVCAKEKMALLKSSKNEKYCVNLLKTEYPNYQIISNDWNTLKQKSMYGNDLEIDIIIRDKYKDLLYIEWNGTWCHSKKDRKTNDKIKKDILGDNLLVIEDPGDHDKPFVENVVETIIKPYLNKILESS